MNNHLKYLLITSLFISFQTKGQPHIEWGGSVGMSIPISTNTLPAGANPSHLILLMETDIYHDRMKHPFCFTWGGRIGAGAGNGVIGLTAGTQYAKAFDKANALRIGLVLGPWLTVVADDRSSVVDINFIPELSAGILHKRLYLGAKYLQPIKSTDYTKTSLGTRPIYSYHDMGIALDIKIRFGKL